MMVRKKWRRQTAAALAFVFAFAAWGIRSYAAPPEELEEQMSEMEEELGNIREELLSLSEEVSTAEMQTEILDGEIRKTQDRLEEAEAEVRSQYDAMKARIKYIYEHDNASLLELLFTSESLADFLNRAEFIRNISEYDRDALESLRAASRKIEAEQTDLETQKASLESIRKELEQDRQELQAKAEATATDLEELERQVRAAKAELRQEASSGSYIVTADEITLLAALLDCEAIHDYDAMLAVATVVMNRVESPLFGGSISEVIYADGQFEPVWTGRLSARLAAGPTSMAQQVARDAAGGARLAAVSDCYYFLYAPSASRSGVTVGDNVFFREW